MPEDRIFKGKLRETEKRCQLLQHSSSEGSHTLSSFRGKATPTEHIFPFEGEEKQWVCCCSPRALLLAEGCHCGQRMPPASGLSNWFLAQKGRPSESCPRAMSKALNITPCYPESGPRRICRCSAQSLRKKRTNNMGRC